MTRGGRALRAAVVTGLYLLVLAVPGALLPGVPAAASSGTTIDVYADCGGSTSGAGPALVNALQAAQDGTMDQCTGLYGTSGTATTPIPGPYTLILDPAQTYVLTVGNNYSDGPDGLPAIINQVTLQSSVAGQQAVIERSGSTAFRFFDVAGTGAQYQTPADVNASPPTTTSSPAPAGNLTLQDIALEGGLAQGGDGGTCGGGGAGLGGAIFSHGGSVTVLDSVLQGNTAQGGSGGAYVPTPSCIGGGGAMGGSGGLGGPEPDPYSGGGGGTQQDGVSGTSTSSGGGGEPNGGVITVNGGNAGYGGGGAASSIYAAIAGGAGGFGGGGGGGPFLNLSGGDGGFGGGGGASGDMGFASSGGFGGGGGGGFSGLTGGSGGFGGGAGYFGFGGGGGGGGGGGMGGAIFTLGGTLTVHGSTLSGNSAQGGQSSTTAQAGSAYGGAVFVESASGHNGPGGSGTCTNSACGQQAEAFVTNTLFTGATSPTPSVYVDGTLAGGSVVPGAAEQLAFAVQPGGGTQDTALQVQPQVAVEDLNGNTAATGTTGSVTLSLSQLSGTAGAALGGTESVVAADSMAAFTGLQVSEPGTYELTATFSGAGVASAVSAPFVVTAGAPASVHLTSSSSSVGVGGTAVVTGAVYDAGGHAVPGAAVTLSATDSDGAPPGSISPATVTTDANGAFQATYIAPQSTGQVTLAATAGTATSTETVTVTSALAPEAVSIALSPADPTQGYQPVNLTGSVVGLNGNPVPDVAVYLTASAPIFSGSVSESVYSSGSGSGVGTYAATFTAPAAAAPVLITATVPSLDLSTTTVLAVASVTPGGFAAGSTAPSGTTLLLGGAGSGTPDLTLAAAGGSGSGSVTVYGGNPVTSSAAPDGASGFFDAGLVAGAGFTSASIDDCGLAGGAATAYWWDAASGSWQVVSPQGVVGGCLILGPFTTTTSPDLAELTGTPFAVAITLTAGDQLKWSPLPLAAVGTLAAGQSVSAAVEAEDSAGNPIPGASVYLSLAQASGGGSATVGGLALSSTPQAFVAGSGGQVQVLYQAPATLPASGTDVLTAGSTDSGAGVSATDSYVFGSGTSTSGGGSASTSSSGGSGAASSPAPSAGGSTGQTVGPAGGTLATSDGAFSLNVPVGAIASGTLALAESCAAPARLPAGFTAASCVFNLTGAALSRPQAATLRYNASALNGHSSQRLALYAQATSGGWRYVPAALDAAAGTVSVEVGGPATLVVLANTQSFPDLPAGYWARDAIDRLLAAGVVTGMPDGSFQPERSVTRAQFVKMLDLALGLRPGTAPAQFADVAPTAWYAPYVSAAVQAGLVDGVSASLFDPNGTFSREQMAVLLARALKLSKTAARAFSDNGTIAAWARQGVAEAVAAGYMSGFPNGTFQPDGMATRAQAAQVLAMVLAQEHPAATSG